VGARPPTRNTFLFYLVAIVYFLMQIARKPVLPTMPAVLLAAT
jgi:hypothetical protein